jgi:hypothetical protein
MFKSKIQSRYSCDIWPVKDLVIVSVSCQIWVYATKCVSLCRDTCAALVSFHNWIQKHAAEYRVYLRAWNNMFTPGRPRCRWEDDTKVDPKGTGWETWLMWLRIETCSGTVVNTVMNNRVLENVGNFLTGWMIISVSGSTLLVGFIYLVSYRSPSETIY